MSVSERMPFVAIQNGIKTQLFAKLKIFADNTATIKNKFLNLWCSQAEIITNPYKNENLFNHLEYYIFDFCDFRHGY